MKGKKMEFVSIIKRDGSGTLNIEDRCNDYLDKEKFKIFPLSITNKTYIAIGFNSYVVRLNKDKK